jgi:hypothetical protein
MFDAFLKRVWRGGRGGRRRGRSSGCRCRCHSWRCHRGRTRYGCRCRSRGWRGCYRRPRGLAMALAKQNSREAKDGRLDHMPHTGSRRPRERTSDRDPARREFWLGTSDRIAFSRSRVVGIRHINRNLGSLPLTGNPIGKAKLKAQRRSSGCLPRSLLFDQYSDFSLAKTKLYPIVHVRNRKHP